MNLQSVRPRFSPFAVAHALLVLVTVLFSAPILWTNGMVGNFGDIYQYAAPFRYLSQMSFQTGAVPLWNPWIFAGTPFLASPQSSLFYPLSAGFAFLPMNVAFNLFTVLHLYLNALGMFLFLSSLRCSSMACLVGSVAWAFSFFFLSKVAGGHVIHLSGYSWTPFVLLFAVRSLGHLRQNGQESNFGSLSFLCLVLSSLIQFFSGHLQVWFHTVFLAGLIWIWKGFKSDPQGRKALVAWGVLWAFLLTGLSLVQSFPTFIYTLYSFRTRTREIFNPQSVYDFATSYSLPWKALWGLCDPGFAGNPLQKNFLDLNHPSIYFETYALYMGILPFLFAVIWLLVSAVRKKFFLPSLCVLSLLLAAGKNSFLYNFVWQGFSFLRVPARFYVLCLFGLVCALAAFWDEILVKKAVRLQGIIFCVVLADLYVHGRMFLWSENYSQKIGASEVMEWLGERKIVRSLPYRIFSKAAVGNPNKTMFFQISNVNGYEALFQRSLLRFFASTEGSASVSTTGVDFERPDPRTLALFSVRYLISLEPLPIPWPIQHQSGELKIYENPDRFRPVQAVFSLKRFGNARDLFAAMNSKDFKPGKEIFTVGGGGNDLRPEREVVLSSFSRPFPGRIEMEWELRDPASFWIFLSEAYFPGWEVWTDEGTRLVPFQADGYFQGVFLSSQKSRQKVFWLFRPMDFRIGAWVTMVSVLGLMVQGMVVFRRKFLFERAG